MTTASTGDTVRVIYTISLDNGTKYQPLHPGDTLDFTLGRGSVLPGFERAVQGMGKGELRQVRIPAADAYGPHRPEKIFTIPCSSLIDQDRPPVVGTVVRVAGGDEAEFFAVVRDVNASGVLLDANHPLCGQDVLFDIQLLEISRPAEAEVPERSRNGLTHPVPSL